MPVDVRQASDRKREELEDPEGWAAQLRLAPNVGSVPHFADERTPAGDRPGLRASARSAGHDPQAPTRLQRPSGGDAPPIESAATISLSASPDSGWATLKGFLEATEQSLVVGLYDFTSKHVLDTVTKAARAKQLTLVLDHPPKNPTADQADADTVADLRDALGDRFVQAWALTRPIDPRASAAAAAQARHGDRDWHVVMKEPQIAQVFEAYLLHDHATAAEHNGPPEQAGPPLTPPGLGSSQTPPFAQFFPATSLSATVKVTPLLTPDPGVYADAVKALIASAEHTLYMRFQYIELPRKADATSQAFVDLVQAVIDRQLVSSQNWSTDGTLYNRDAGVILHDASAAQYFQQIFLHDWEHLATRQARPD